MSVWEHLPKSSGLGKLSKKHKKAFAKSQSNRKVKKPVIKAKCGKTKKQSKAYDNWHFWGSRKTLGSKDRVVASLKRQGYKVRVDGVGDYYKIYVIGRPSYYS